MNFRLSLSGYPGIVRAHPVVGVSGGHCQAVQAQVANVTVSMFRFCHCPGIQVQVLPLSRCPGIVKAHPVVGVSGVAIVRAHPEEGVSGVAIVGNAGARPALVSALQLCPTNTISPSLCRT